MNTGNRQARRAWAAARKRHIKRGKVYHVEIQHDADCPIYGPHRLCNCDPLRVLKDATGRTLASIAGAGFYDPLEFCGVGE